MKRLPVPISKWRRPRTISMLIILLAGLLVTQSVLAGDGGLDVARYVIGGGGGHTHNGSYALDATIGQPIVGVTRSIPTGIYELCSGFWCGLGAHKVYLPLLLRN